MADPATEAQRQPSASETAPRPPQDAGDPPGAAGASRELGTAKEEMVAFLERDQLVVDRSVPVPAARLGPGAQTALWVLRVLVTVVSAMVIYAFVDGLR